MTEVPGAAAAIQSATVARVTATSTATMAAMAATSAVAASSQHWPQRQHSALVTPPAATTLAGRIAAPW